MNDLDDVIERVRKLLSLAQSNNANEAAAAAAAANKLMDKYRLSHADLECSGQEAAEPIEEDPDYIYATGKVTMWKWTLLNVLAQHYGCTIWNDTSFDTGRQFSRFRSVGRKSDLTILRYMFAWLTMECSRITKNFAGSGRIVINSYCDGFVSGIRQQLAKSREEVKAEASSNAIVLINARSEEAKTWLFAQRTNLRTVKMASHAHRDRSAYSAGQERGRNMHLGAALDVGSKTKMLT